MNKIELYTDLNRDFQALMAGETSFLATLANTSALLYERLAEVNWAGFYLLEDDTLVQESKHPKVGQSRPVAPPNTFGCFDSCASAAGYGNEGSDPERPDNL